MARCIHNSTNLFQKQFICKAGITILIESIFTAVIKVRHLTVIITFRLAPYNKNIVMHRVARSENVTRSFRVYLLLSSSGEGIVSQEGPVPE